MRRPVRIIVLAAVLAAVAAAASAQDLAPEIEATCEAPLSLCSTGPPSPCPEGYACSCVPSCPECDDCAAEVCVREGRECRTACDCPTGLGCVDGACIAGVAPVYCCDAGPCPAGGSCQHADGRLDLCEDPRCRKRQEKVASGIASRVRRWNACESASDCAQVGTSTGCGGTCGAWVNREHAKRLARAVERLDERHCSTYVADGCPFATPGCLVEEAACEQGVCTGRPVPLVDGPLVEGSIETLEPAAP